MKQGRLVLLGVTQEQHADRCRLFAQWKRFDWPILHDPINLLEAPAVPIVVAIDEHGIVRAVRPRPETFAAEFLDKTFADDAQPGAPRSSGPPDSASLLRTRRRQTPPPVPGATVGDALTIWGGAERRRRGDRCLRPRPGARPRGQKCPVPARCRPPDAPRVGRAKAR